MPQARFRRLQVLAALWLAVSGLALLPVQAIEAEQPAQPVPPGFQEVLERLGVGVPYSSEECEQTMGGTVIPIHGLIARGFYATFNTFALPALTFDAPVAQGLETSWLFGATTNQPGPFSMLYLEPYLEGEFVWMGCGSIDWPLLGEVTNRGARWVLYTDKGRLELPTLLRPQVEHNGQVFLYRYPWSPDAAWSITAGLLARELLTGQLQVGDNIFLQREPASIPVAGDPDGSGVTYAALGKVMGYGPLPAGWRVIQTIDSEGQVGAEPSLAAYGVTHRDIGAPTQHTVANVFWDFFQQPGWQAQDVVGIWSGDVTSSFPLGFSYTLTQASHRFPWLWLVGWPLTEPYWTRAKVAGQEQWVLVQCFERRCLTYTPANPPGWQVEMGNIGRHYVMWRYGTAPPVEAWQLPWWSEYQP